jgi:hypothetical protein
VVKIKVASPAAPKKETFWDLERDGLTQSLIGLWQACPEMARLRYAEGWTPMMPSVALQFGTLVHNVLEDTYNTMLEGKTVTSDDVMGFISKREEAFFKNSRLLDPQTHDKFQQMLGIAEALLPAYLDYWREDDRKINWQHLEGKFEVPCNGVKLRGKFDGVFTDAAGRLWLLETKTASQVVEDTLLDRLSFNLQNCIYLLALEIKTGQKPAGVLYNILRKSQLRIKAKETIPEFIKRCAEDIAERPEHYFYRYEVSINEDEMNQWKQEFTGLLNQVKRWNAGEFHYKCSGSCSNHFGPCDFLAACGRGEFSNYTKREFVFPELEEE